MAISNYKRMNVDLLASLVGYNVSIIPPPTSEGGGELRLFNGLTEPENLYGLWFKTEEVLSSSKVEVFIPFGEGTWEYNTNMPSGDYQLAGASVGTKVYMCGGYINKTATRIYDTTTGVWTAGNAMPSGDYQLAGASVGTKVYMCGGSYPTATRTLTIPNLTYVDNTVVILSGKPIDSNMLGATQILENFTIFVENTWIVKNGLLVDFETYIANGVEWQLLKSAS